MSKSPAFQFYPADYLSDRKVIVMTPYQRGLYIHLLCIDWLEDGFPEKDAQKLSGCSPDQWEQDGLSVVEGCFKKHPTKEGFLTNERLCEERKKQAEWRKKSTLGGRKSASRRKTLAISKTSKRKGGSNLVDTKKEPKVNSSSSSSSSSTSTNISTNVDIPLTPLGGEFIFPVMWGEKAKSALEKWKEYRISIKKPLKPPTLQAQIDHYAETPKTFVALVNRAIINGWQGLNSQIPIAEGASNAKSPPRKSQNLLNQDRSVDAVRTILEECGHEVGRDEFDIGKI